MGVLKRFGATFGAVGLLAVGVGAAPTSAVAADSISCQPAAPSGPNSFSHSVGLAAASDFSSVSGTTETDIFISAFDTASGSIAFLQIEIFDTVTGTSSVDAAGCIENPDFQIAQTLTTATLAPTVFTLVDSISNTSSTATVSGSWTGISDMSRQAQTSHFHSGKFTNIFNFIGFERLADATGTASDPDLGLTFDGAAFSASLDKFNEVFLFVCAAGGC